MGLDWGQSLHSFWQIAWTQEAIFPQLKRKKITIIHFLPLFPPPTIEVLTVGQLLSTFLSKRLHSFGISETRICFLKNTCHWIPFNLTCDWNFCFNNSIFYKGCLYILLKMTKQKPLLLSLHFPLSCSVIQRSFFLSLSLSSFPPALGSIQPLQSQSSQSFRKGPFCRALFGGILINHFRYCCLLGEMET